jgi:hypothetical protein
MSIYGIDRVRGGPWVKEQLSLEDHRAIQRLVSFLYGLCFWCNSSDHFVSHCPLLQRGSLSLASAPSNTNIANGTIFQGPLPQQPVHLPSIPFLESHHFNVLTPVLNLPGAHNPQIPQNMFCVRCGRTSHVAEMCYATTYWFGDEILGEYVCFRCGWSGYFKYRCYAKRDIWGNPL